jgi:hypothetical protein
LFQASSPAARRAASWAREVEAAAAIIKDKPTAKAKSFMSAPAEFRPRRPICT